MRLHSVPAVLGGGLQDPDSDMRLLRIEGAVDAGRWLITYHVALVAIAIATWGLWGVQMVLICPHHACSAMLDGAATTLFDRMNNGDLPAWLHPLPRPSNAAWVLHSLQVTAAQGNPR